MAKRGEQRQQVLGVLDDSRPGFLKRGRVRSAVGRAHYKQGSADFRQWCQRNGHGDAERFSHDQLDRRLESYVEYIFLSNSGIFSARMAVYGEAWLRSLILKVPTTLFNARSALEGWVKLVPEQSKEPLPWITCSLVIQQLCQDADLKGKPVLRDSAECLAVQYDSYVRPDVACRLSDINVVLPPAGSVKSCYKKVGLLLSPSGTTSQSKTNSQDDSVVLGINPDRSFVPDLVQRLHRRAVRNGGGALWPRLTLASYEAGIRDAAAALGLASHKISPHLARHRGISTDVYEKVVTLEEGAKRGHWRAMASVRRYEKHGRLLKMINQLSDDQRNKALAASKQIGNLLLNGVK